LAKRQRAEEAAGGEGGGGGERGKGEIKATDPTSRASEVKEG
jgi:hypothetical protein